MKTPKIKKRENLPRTFVKLNEEKFVEEIRKFPILYDCTLRDYKKVAYKNAAWKEVGNAMNLTEGECKKRWRSLRDAFVKNLKAHSEDDIRVTHWIHYRLLEFLLPYIDRNATRKRIRTDEFIDDDDYEDEMTISEDISKEEYHEEKESPITYVSNSELNDMIDVNEEEHLEQQTVLIHDDVEEQIEEEGTVIIEGLENQNDDSDCSENHPIFISMAQLEKVKEPLSSATSSNRKCHTDILEEHVISSGSRPTSFISDSDSDEKFLLSCTPILRRMSAKKNHLARLKIQQILYEIEYDEKI